MKRYNLTVKIFADVAINASSISEARLAIQEKLPDAILQLVDLPEFMVEGGEITGIFDMDWNELDKATT